MVIFKLFVNLQFYFTILSFLIGICVIFLFVLCQQIQIVN